MEQQLGLLEAADVYWTNGRGFALSVRESRRARNLIIQVVPPGIVELVIPRGTRSREVQRFVDENRTWIDRACAAYGAHAQVPTFPESVWLAACGREIRVEQTPGAGSGWDETDGVLRIRTRSDDPREVRLSLRRWFMATARSELKPRLAEQAERLGLRPGAVQVRLQRTRWGSCSARGTISLNACLMLVEPALVRYLLVHELCHLRHLDHSRRYWREVARFEPEFRSLDRQLGAAWTSLPPWIFRLFRAD